MSILLKGMKMQMRCIDCPFMASRENDDCILQSEKANKKAITWDDMKENCPLVEIPPHGDLVDRDELLAEYDRQHKGPAGGARRIMEDAPTIIEAEGSEK